MTIAQRWTNNVQEQTKPKQPTTQQQPTQPATQPATMSNNYKQYKQQVLQGLLNKGTTNGNI